MSLPPEPPASTPESEAVTNPDLVRSSFDDEDRINDDLIPERGSITHSSFDDDDRVDRHPVP
jgi:hypothetical protein